jgi:hypothetical protein
MIRRNYCIGATMHKNIQQKPEPEEVGFADMPDPKNTLTLNGAIAVLVIIGIVVLLLATAVEWR